MLELDIRFSIYLSIYIYGIRFRLEHHNTKTAMFTYAYNHMYFTIGYIGPHFSFPQ